MRRGALALIGVTVAACSTEPDIRVIAPEVVHTDKKKTGCSAKGCAVDPIEGPSNAELEAWLETYNASPVDESTEALDSLIFHGPHTQAYLGSYGAGALDDAHARFLKRELRRGHAFIDMRIIDDAGVVRASLGERRVPLRQKTHQFFEDGDRVNLQRFETNGSVVRTGLHHLWSRY